jgi:hypothetical protein
MATATGTLRLISNTPDTGLPMFTRSWAQRAIVRQQHATVAPPSPESPGHQRRRVRHPELDKVQVWLFAKQPAHDVVIEVLVGGEAEHLCALSLIPASKQPRADALRIKLSFILLANSLSLGSSLLQVGIHFDAMI